MTRTVLRSFFAYVGSAEEYPTAPQATAHLQGVGIGQAELWMSDYSYIPPTDWPWLWLLLFMRGYSVREIAVRFHRRPKEIADAVRTLRPIPESAEIKRAREQYAGQQNAARTRGIAWLFSFSSWLQVWRDSGLHSSRGNRSGGYVMGRRGDVGPYAPGNVCIIPHEENIREGIRNAIARGTYVPRRGARSIA